MTELYQNCRACENLRQWHRSKPCVVQNVQHTLKIKVAGLNFACHVWNVWCCTHIYGHDSQVVDGFGQIAEIFQTRPEPLNCCKRRIHSTPSPLVCSLHKSSCTILKQRQGLPRSLRVFSFQFGPSTLLGSNATLLEIELLTVKLSTSFQHCGQN
jgi:hypothetical protein